VFKGRANQSVVKLIDVSGSAKGNANAQTKFYVIRNATLSGPVNFAQSATNSSTYVDVAATGMTTPTRDQTVYSISLPESGNFDHAFADTEITLQPGESATLAMKSLSSTADCTGTMNTREDQ